MSPASPRLELTQVLTDRTENIYLELTSDRGSC
jgi:hypothetical protein